MVSAWPDPFSLRRVWLVRLGTCMLLPSHVCFIHCVLPCRLQTGTIFTVNLNTVSSWLQLLSYLHFLSFGFIQLAEESPLSLLAYHIKAIHHSIHLPIFMKAWYNACYVMWCDVMCLYMHGWYKVLPLLDVPSVCYHHGGTIFWWDSGVKYVNKCACVIS